MRTKSIGTYIIAFLGVALALTVISAVLGMFFFLLFRVVLPVATFIFLVYLVKQYLDRNYKYGKNCKRR